VAFGDLVAAALGEEVVAVHVVGGGDVAESYRVQLADGRRVFAKTHADPPPLFFETEASSLEWLRAAAAVRIPAVLAVQPGLLVLEWVEVQRSGSRSDRRTCRSSTA
jgi:fructosamine-3-kinase